MVNWKFKLWRGVGAAALLSACGQPATPDEAPAPAAVGGEAAIGEGGGEHGVEAVYAGLSGDQRVALRLQHLKGYLLVAERVTEGDRPIDAGVLVQQGLLEAYDPASDEFGALDVATVRAASDGANLSRAQMSQRLQAGEAAIDQARNALHVNHADLAVRLVDLAAGLYQNVVQPDFIDPIEYQHSLGAALSARDALVAGEAALQRDNRAAYDEALGELNRLIEMWPAPSAPEQPTSYQDVLRQSSRVRLALSPYL